MRTIQCDQGSAQWLEVRRGKITASRICDVLNVLKKGGEGADRKNYRTELIAERLSGRSEDHYISPEMVWGSEVEPEARTAYEMERGLMVDQVGFVLHPVFDYSGASPDALVGEDGLIEIKCPKTTTHIKWMLAGVVPEEHGAQCLWNMICTQRSWCDFISYDPRLPDGLRMFAVRMHAEIPRIIEVEQEVQRFNGEVEKICKELSCLIRIPAPKPVDTRTPFEQVYDLVGAEIVP